MIMFAEFLYNDRVTGQQNAFAEVIAAQPRSVSMSNTGSHDLTCAVLWNLWNTLELSWRLMRLLRSKTIPFRFYNSKKKKKD